ncbi:MAG: NADH-quinone oxidoreductase subunit N [Anaerolineae bacterium]|nr:NADH-quinone oxidoreductase subunit N [Anaerolineae bacterium]
MGILEYLSANLPAIAPEIGLTILAMVILLVDSYRPDAKSNIGYLAAIVMALLAITPFIPGWSPAMGESSLKWGGMIRHDMLASIFKVMILFAGSITSLMAVKDSAVGQKGEFYLIITISTLGASLLAASADIVMLFVALETVSIPLYILAGFSHSDAGSAESGLKYFLFGSFASAILLYGLSLLFGFTGETQLTAIAASLTSSESILGTNILPALAALTLVIVGFGFKISAAPFHFWTPDVYEGAPTPVTAFISVASKAASFAVLMRFFIGVFPDAVQLDGQSVQAFWTGLITVMAVVSMTLGNVLALRQENMKRMLAYSSIAQAGYALVGVAALQSVDQAVMTSAISSVAFYMFMYTFSNLLVFAGVILFSEAAGTEKISEYAGMQRRSPWLAVTMTIGLLSLAGIPPAAGFFGKFFLFQAAVQANLAGLAIIGVLNSIVALYYYLLVIKIMWVDPGKDEDQAIKIPAPLAWTFGITTIVVLLLGVVPAPIIGWARDGAAAVAQAVTIGLP